MLDNEVLDIACGAVLVRNYQPVLKTKVLCSKENWTRWLKGWESSSGGR